MTIQNIIFKTTSVGPTWARIRRTNSLPPQRGITRLISKKNYPPDKQRLDCINCVDKIVEKLPLQRHPSSEQIKGMWGCEGDHLHGRTLYTSYIIFEC